MEGTRLLNATDLPPEQSSGQPRDRSADDPDDAAVSQDERAQAMGAALVRHAADLAWDEILRTHGLEPRSSGKTTRVPDAPLDVFLAYLSAGGFQDVHLNLTIADRHIELSLDRLTSYHLPWRAGDSHASRAASCNPRRSPIGSTASRPPL